MAERIREKDLTIAINILYTKNEKIYLAYLSKQKSMWEKQVIVLMVWNGEK